MKDKKGKKNRREMPAPMATAVATDATPAKVMYASDSNRGVSAAMRLVSAALSFSISGWRCVASRLRLQGRGVERS